VLQLEVRRQKPGNAVPKARGQRTTIHLLEGDFVSGAAFGLDDSIDRLGQGDVVALEVVFEIEAKAAGIPVC